MPHLAHILIYPVKSFDAQPVESARVLSSGALANDRRYALRDENGQFVNAKRFAKIHLLRSCLDPATGLLSLRNQASMTPVTFHVDRDRDALDRQMSSFFQRPVHLEENPAAGFPDDTDSPGPTIISTETLIEVASWFPGLSVQQMRARLRANLEIAGVPAFWEDRLYGLAGSPLRFRLGEVAFDGMNPCQRCNVPPRDPFTGENNPNFTQTFRQRREETLPPWAERSRFNHFYRLAINTCIPISEAGKTLRVGDQLVIPAAAVAQSV